MTTEARYLRNQAVVTGLINAIVNPLIEWWSRRGEGCQPLWGSEGAVVNLVVTSLVLSVLVAVITGYSAWRRPAAQRVRTGWFTRLPGCSWRLGLLLGAGAGAGIVVVAGLLDLLGLTCVTLTQMLVVKAVYCGVLGFAVARWTILRQWAG
ncbi:hypothetical protein IU449_19050 [Nocardia higoensis]|uniref:Uncharacterized protein n=1 Tax=Nocardia higoensis TaxID=228599 RepID=A0ABS0DDR8_9NOCA|nr:hypothetical protein [Nocardia higoensis]MBF6356616.1 hypothetical protein [Nocardia higoensis]